MALVISVKKGGDFFVGDDRFVLTEIINPKEVLLCKENGDVVHVTGQLWSELLPGVKVQAGTPGNFSSRKVVRLAIDAPGVFISRGELYRKRLADNRIASERETPLNNPLT